MKRKDFILRLAHEMKVELLRYEGDDKYKLRELVSIAEFKRVAKHLANYIDEAGLQPPIRMRVDEDTLLRGPVSGWEDL